MHENWRNVNELKQKKMSAAKKEHFKKNEKIKIGYLCQVLAGYTSANNKPLR